MLKFLRLGRLAREHQGSMLVEFALVLPGFFLLLLGGLAVTDALSAYQRVQNIAGTVGIMASRLTTVTNGDMAGIAAAARSYLFPYSDNDLSVLIAAVWVDDKGVPTIRWCERWNKTSGKGGTCSGTAVFGGTNLGYWETGSNISINDLNIPAGIIKASTGLVVVQSSYDWKAPYGRISLAMLTDLTMHDSFFYSPRGDVTLAPPKRDRASPIPSGSFTISGS